MSQNDSYPDVPVPDEQEQQELQDTLALLKSLVPHLNYDGSVPLHPMEHFLMFLNPYEKRLTIILTRKGVSLPPSKTFSEKELAHLILQLQKMLRRMRMLE